MWAVTVGSGPCPECGADPARELRPGSWERVKYWVVNGTKAPATLVCPDGHEWTATFAVLAFGNRAVGPRWARLPGEILRLLLAERRMTPVPLTYLMAAGVGLILGVSLDLILGWPWWMVAVGFVVVVWMFFLASAFRSPRKDIGHRLLRVIDPERAAARDIERLDDALASGDLVGHEVRDWEGERSIAGWGGGATPDSLTLRCGSLDDGLGWVEVTTHTGDWAYSARGWVQEELERRLADATIPLPDEPTIEDFRRRQRDIQDTKPPAWQSASIRIGDETIPGQIARAGGQWAAYFETGDVLVELLGSEVDPDEVELASVTNLDRYRKR